MSLLGEIRGIGGGPDEDVVPALRRLCAEVLARNRLPPAAVVAARIRVPAFVPGAIAAVQELGWSRFPIFWEIRRDAGLEVVVHVRLKRRRRLVPVALEPAA
ncbi:MAG TPA: hypothetical protein VN033_08550 [Vulgatibacter sp.]|nr:hypothetical protein [Vulgatibacter sp.]